MCLSVSPVSVHHKKYHDNLFEPFFGPQQGRLMSLRIKPVRCLNINLTLATLEGGGGRLIIGRGGLIWMLMGLPLCGPKKRSEDQVSGKDFYQDN